MKTKIDSAVNWLLSGLLALLGFASCGKTTCGGIAEYGTPTAGYRAMGRVADETGKPVKGIEVSRVTRGLSESKTVIGLTDENGRFADTDYAKASFGDIEVTFTDIDGEENGGKFQSKTLTLDDFDATKVRDGKGWYSGDYDISADVKLTKEE